MGLSIPATLHRLTVAAAVLSPPLERPLHLPAAQTTPPATTLVEPPTPLLPSALGSRADSNVIRTDLQTTQGQLDHPEFFNPNTCLPVLNPPAAPPHTESTQAAYCANILKEDGLRRLEAGGFQHQGVHDPVEVTAYEFVDATGAYSAYTFYKTLLNANRLVGPPAGRTA